MPRITIKSIAQDLGVSHMTVSRALSGHPNVREDIRATIVKHAATLGYVKSAAAAAMRGDHTRIVGLLLPNIVNEFYARFANALALYCADRALNLMIYLTDDDTVRERQSLLRLQEMQAGAVVMVPAPVNGENPAPLPVDMQVIQLIRARNLHETDGVLLVEDGPSIRQAVAHLASKGHSHIAFIGSHEGLSSGQHRLAAYREAMAAADLECSSTLIRTNKPSFAMGSDSIISILAETKATALICGGFEISNGALDACLRRGLSLPQDLAFVGYGDPTFYEWIAGGITTVALPVEALAKQAADIIAAAGAKRQNLALALPAKLLIRRST